MVMDFICIRGVWMYNLKNFDFDLFCDKLIVIIGLFGLGKFLLVFDIIYVEGQCCYVELLLVYVCQFLSVMEKLDLDYIEGLFLVILIEQKLILYNLCLMVGMIIEIYDYLCLLYVCVGILCCLDYGYFLEVQMVSQMVDQVLILDLEQCYMLLVLVICDCKGEYVQVFDQLCVQGFVCVCVDGGLYEIDVVLLLVLCQKYIIEVVIDCFCLCEDIKQCLVESFEIVLKLGDGMVLVQSLDNMEFVLILFFFKYFCLVCDYLLLELELCLFLFNVLMGVCFGCDGLGMVEFFDFLCVVVYFELLLVVGVVCGWDCCNVYYFQLIVLLVKYYWFDVDVVWNLLLDKVQQVVLYGSGDEVIIFIYFIEVGGCIQCKYCFEGIIFNFECCYKEIELLVVCEELFKYISEQFCLECYGVCLNKVVCNVFVVDCLLLELVVLLIDEVLKFFSELSLLGWCGEIVVKIVKEIGECFGFFVDVGLDYLILECKVDMLFGGEVQCICLVSQIGVGLVGVMYVFDELLIGLYQCDNECLLGIFICLCDFGNMVIVVEYDEDVICLVDYVLDIGLGVGVYGGEIVGQGILQDILEVLCLLIGQYLLGKCVIEILVCWYKLNLKMILYLCGVSGNNFKGVDLVILLGLLICVIGVFGFGKLILINDILFLLVVNEINGFLYLIVLYREIDGLDLFDKVVDIDQLLIGCILCLNLVIYIGLFIFLCELFVQVLEVCVCGYLLGCFSFNVCGGCCEVCQGDGLIKVEMYFLLDVYVLCDVCYGKCYNCEMLEILYKGFNINDVLEMIVEDVLKLFELVLLIVCKLEILVDVGLSYIKLGQSVIMLFGGEVQCVKLFKELLCCDIGCILYIFDELIIGLYFYDIEVLLGVLYKLCDEGNMVVVIEYNLDVIKIVDWIVDLGLEGGYRGGIILVIGMLEDVVVCLQLYIGQFLVCMLLFISVCFEQLVVVVNKFDVCLLCKVKFEKLVKVVKKVVVVKSIGKVSKSMMKKKDV